MRVWLDDIRNAPGGWTRTYTVAQTLELLRTGQVCEISLDYDLPETDPGHTGDEVLVWLRNALIRRRIAAPVIHVHSINPYGAGKMAYMIGRMERRHGWQPMGVVPVQRQAAREQLHPRMRTR